MKSADTDESTAMEHSDQIVKETYLEPVSGSYQVQSTSDENETTITTIAQSFSRPKQKRVQSLDSYREGSPTSSLSENEEQLLLLSWPMVSRKIRMIRGQINRYSANSGSIKNYTDINCRPVDDEDIEIDFQEKAAPPKGDLYSSSESIPLSTPSSVSLFSDRMEAPEIII